jgi:hypothetical protein
VNENTTGISGKLVVPIEDGNDYGGGVSVIQEAQNCKYKNNKIYLE